MSTERWASLKDHTVVMHEENDGRTFINRGAEEREWETTLGKLAAEHPKRLAWLIIEELRAHYYTEHKTETWQNISYAARAEALNDAEDYCTGWLKALTKEMDSIVRMRAWKPCHE